jgi:hypothetical protein
MHHEMQHGMLLGQTVLRDQQQHQAHLRSINGVGSIPTQNIHYQQRPDGMYHQNSLQFPAGMPSHQQPSMHLHQQSAFLPSEHKQLRQHPVPERTMVNNRMLPSPELGVVNMIDPRGKQSGYGPPGMWSEQTASLAVGADGANPRQLRRPDGIGHEQHGPDPRRETVDRRMNSGNVPLSLGLGLPAPGRSLGEMPEDVGGPVAPKAPGRDDSLMVDSLFGPSDGIIEEKNLLTGFQGLSFGDDGLGADMWSNNLTNTWEGEKKSKGPSALFAAIQPNLDSNEHEMQHPSKSRFIWGAAGDGQSPWLHPDQLLSGGWFIFFNLF